LVGEKIKKKKDTIQESHICSRNLGTDVTFFGSGDLYISLQYLFKISSCIFPEVYESLVEKLKDYIQVSQIFVFVVYDRSLKLDFDQNFSLNTTFTETLLFKKKKANCSKSTCILISSSEEVVVDETLALG